MSRIDKQLSGTSALSFRQRLALQVGRAARSPAGDNQDSLGASFPYGFAAYARVAAACKGKKLSTGYMLWNDNARELV
jgi:hypothetical protein